MSRIGKIPVELPKGVEASVAGQTVTVKKGSETLTFDFKPLISVSVEDSQIVIDRNADTRPAKALHGTTRSRIANMVQGVTEGFTKELEIVGVGWNAQVQGNKIALNVGYADTKYVTFPGSVKVEVNGMNIKVTGPDKQAVGQVAADIRATKKPEPYNGKGIKYSDERVVRKEGKTGLG